METTTGTYLSPRNATVMVDRAWAHNLGLSQTPGARRVGSFYRLPRVAYLRALQTMRDQAAGETAFELPSVQVGPRSLAPCSAAAGIRPPQSRSGARARVAA